MTLEEIKAAVRAGKTVCHGTRAYEVRLSQYRDGSGEQWLIVCTFNDYAIGLTWRDGVTMNGKPEDFFIAEPA